MLRFVQWLGYCFRRALDRRRTPRPHSQADLNQHPVRVWREAAMTAVTVPVSEPVAEQQTAARGPMSDRARSEQRLGWRLVTPGGRGDPGGDRLPAGPGRLSVAVQLPVDRPGREGVHRHPQLRRGPHRQPVVATVLTTAVAIAMF